MPNPDVQEPGRGGVGRAGGNSQTGRAGVSARRGVETPVHDGELNHATGQRYIPAFFACISLRS